MERGDFREVPVLVKTASTMRIVTSPRLSLQHSDCSKAASITVSNYRILVFQLGLVVCLLQDPSGQEIAVKDG